MCRVKRKHLRRQINSSHLWSRWNNVKPQSIRRLLTNIPHLKMCPWYSIFIKHVIQYNTVNKTPFIAFLIHVTDSQIINNNWIISLYSYLIFKKNMSFFFNYSYTVFPLLFRTSRMNQLKIQVGLCIWVSYMFCVRQLTRLLCLCWII